MQKRSKSNYVKVFVALKQASKKAGFPLTFKTHVMDFEIAAAQASTQVFPKASISFCHFHLAKSIWKNIRKKSKLLFSIKCSFHQSNYFEDLVVLARKNMVHREIANIIALPLLPSSLVRNRFNTIARTLTSYSNSFLPFVNYVRRTYLNNSRFPIESWNHYNYLGTRPRTNNHLEGTHRQYKTYVLINRSFSLWQSLIFIFKWQFTSFW